MRNRVCSRVELILKIIIILLIIFLGFRVSLVNAQSIMDKKENQFRNSKYSKQYKKAYEQHQEKTSRISRPCDEKGKARAFVDNRKDRRKKKQRSSKNKNTRRYSSMAGKKHCGDVCGSKRSQKVEGHDRLRLQQTRQLMIMMLVNRKQ